MIIRKKKLVIAVGIFVLVIISIAVLLNFNQSTVPENEKITKDLVLADIPNHENIENANIKFGKIDITDNIANVDIMLDWDPELCVSYNYKLSKFFGSWKITSSERTIVC